MVESRLADHQLLEYHLGFLFDSKIDLPLRLDCCRLSCDIVLLFLNLWEHCSLYNDLLQDDVDEPGDLLICKLLVSEEPKKLVFILVLFDGLSVESLFYHFFFLLLDLSFTSLYDEFIG